MKTQRLTILALFTTLAMIIFTIESAIPPVIPIPGIKLGLANIITLIVLQHFSAGDAFLVLMLRIILSSFLYGQALSLLYSLAGGCLCLLAMLLVQKLLQKKHLVLTSIIGGIFHNLGQLAVAWLVTRTAGVLAYLPFLLLSGILTGTFTGICAHFTSLHLHTLKAAAPFFVKSDDDN